MNGATIKLNQENSIDLPKLIEGGLVILANSGGGKSFAIRRIAEQAVNKVQVIILDPEGEFASLREKFDFILAGKDADVPVEVRSASMLATRLLELNKSAVIDLYELHPQERQRYVKLFCEALVNAPKNLYHPVIIVLDEAHEYVPEGKPSEATWAVESLASKGRKRGQRLILASQRIAKISKNVTAECNNKLIGRASQDIDMKRAGDELGFNKEKLVQLRQLKPGEFFAFGPAISDEVIKIKVGDVKTTHAKVGYKGVTKTPPPSDVIKRVLGELKDLPQEAEKEAKTTAELKKENAELKRQNTNLLKQPFQKNLTPAEIEKMAMPYVKILLEKSKKINIQIMTLGSTLSKIKEMIPDVMPMIDLDGLFVVSGNPQTPHLPNLPIEAYRSDIKKNGLVKSEVSIDGQLGKGEMIMLQAIAQFPEGITTEHLAVLTGYKNTSRRTYLQRLLQREYITSANGMYYLDDFGRNALGDNYEPLPTGDALREHVLRTLPEGEKKVLKVVIESYPQGIDVESIEVATGYKPTSRRTYLQRLSARKLVVISGQIIKASDKLFN